MKPFLLAAALAAGATSAFAAALSPVDLGAKLIAEKRYPEAVKVLETEARANPGSPNVLLNLGWAYWHSRKLGKAWNVGTTLIKLDPENVSFMVFLANTEIERSNYERAISLMNRALKLAPEDKNASMVLARALFRAKRENEAIAVLDGLAAVFPDDPAITFRKASFLSDMGRKRDGLQLLEKLLASDADNAAYRRARAKILEDLGQPDEAKAEWKYLSGKRADADSLINLGWTYWREGNFAEAREIATPL
jgi:tetratricopeptide (TPR) repeat protein